MINPQVDLYLQEGCGRCKLYRTPACKVHRWVPVLDALREILSVSGLKEEIKWSVPCYTWNGKNVLILAAFKEYAALNFFKGSLLPDPECLLIRAGDNSHVARQMRFLSVSDVQKYADKIQVYLQEAIQIEKEGKKVAPNTQKEPIPDEFLEVLNQQPQLKIAFYKLTPGRQRAYILHFSQPKQSKTRISRIEKCIEKILSGKGLHDEYSC